MHLRCEYHERRVLVLKRTTVHRSDGSTCNHPWDLQIGSRRLTAARVRNETAHDGYILSSQMADM